MPDRKQKAASAVRLLKAALQVDDQDAADFLSSVIEAEELYLECCSDDGSPLATMEQFAAELEVEATGTSPAASFTPRRITPDERYRARMAALGR